MLNNNKYFNQVELSKEKVQKGLAHYFEGIDIDSIVELINKDIKEKHENDETFEGSITLPDCKIRYLYEFIPWNAAFVCDELAKMKYAKIVIYQDDIVLILVGTDHSIEAKRTTNNENMTFEHKFEPTKEPMDIKEPETNTKSLKMGKSNS